MASGGKRDGAGRKKGATGKAISVLREKINPEMVEEALTCIMTAIQNGNIEASKYLLDQKFGKARQSMELEHSGGVKLIKDDID